VWILRRLGIGRNAITINFVQRRVDFNHIADLMAKSVADHAGVLNPPALTLGA